MANELEADYKIFHDSDGWNVYKLDEKGNKAEKKNKEPYKSRQAALPYLRALYSHQPKSEKATASEEETVMETNEVIASTELVLGSVHFEADVDNPRFLRFHDAVLARAEMNANRDELDNDGISELAATISATAIDIEHDDTKNIGFYTAGKNDNGVLKVDGVVWTDRCAKLGIDPNDIESGKYRLSIEAEAATAECSSCHAVYTDAKSYCLHLKAKLVHGAKRILRGLRAVGGAVTMKPAGTDTVFSPSIMFVASHQEEQETMANETNELSASEVVEMWIASIVEGVSKREDVSPADKKRAEKEYGDVEYADEKNKKYPLDEEHIHSALSYWGKPENRAKYSSEDQKKIGDRIRRAAKRLGVEVSDDKKSKSESSKETDMDDKEMDKKHDEMHEDPKEEKTETPKEEKKENEAEGQAEYAKMKADMDKLAADLEARNADLKNEQTAKATIEAKVTEMEARITALEASLQSARGEVKAHKVERIKARLVGSVYSEEQFVAKQDKLLAADDDYIEMLIAAASKPTSEDKSGANRLMAAESAPQNGRKIIVG